MNNRNRVFRLAVVSASVIGLLACGGGEEAGGSTTGEDNNGQEQITLGTHEGLVFIAPDQTGYVNLTPYISRGNGVDVTLSDVQLLEDSYECGQPKLDEHRQLGFSTTIQGSRMCRYQYEVAGQTTTQSYSSDAELRNIITVATSTSGHPDLPPLNVTVGLTSPQVDLDLSSLFALAGETYPPGYTLTSELTVVGDGTATPNYPGANMIRYVAANEGYSQILYQLDKTGDTKYGLINVAVSTGTNVPPTAEDHTVYATPIEINTPLEIDVTSYVTPNDGDDFNVISVSSNNATTAVKDPNDVTNKIFTFNAPVSGIHYVSYVISDHRGGYDVGSIQIEATDPAQGATWDDIYSNNLWYKAPLTRTEALAQGVPHTGGFYDGGYTPSMNIATFSFNQANEHCANDYVRLPTSSELLAIYNETSPGTPGTIYNWPVENSYWAKDGTTPVLVSLDTGVVESLDAQPHYVTCVVPNGTLTITRPKPVAIANGTDKAQVVATFNEPGGAGPGMGHTIEATVISGGGSLISNSEITDASGKAMFEVTSTIAGSTFLEISAEVGVGAIYTQEVKVKHTGDAANTLLYITSLSSGVKYADGISAYEYEVTAEDTAGNVVSGETIDFTAPSQMTIHNGTNKTDDAGHLYFSATSTLAGANPITLTPQSNPSAAETVTPVYVTPLEYEFDFPWGATVWIPYKLLEQLGAQKEVWWDSVRSVTATTWEGGSSTTEIRGLNLAANTSYKSDGRYYNAHVRVCNFLNDKKLDGVAWGKTPSAHLYYSNPQDLNEILEREDLPVSFHLGVYPNKASKFLTINDNDIGDFAPRYIASEDEVGDTFWTLMPTDFSWTSSPKMFVTCVRAP